MPSSSTPRSSSDPARPQPVSIGDALQWLHKNFSAERSKDASVAYQFELSGNGGGALWARVADGRLESGVGAVADPDVVFRLEASLLFGVLGGSVNPDLLFMERKLEIDGDLSLALKLRSFFSASG